MMTYCKQIEIKWTYPKEMNAAWLSDDSFGRGIYQITRVFGGNESLLYFGLVKREGRDFYIRLIEHWDWMSQVRGQVYIRFGKVVPKKGFKLTEEIIETIEGALINEYQPPFNITKKGYYTLYHHVHITNKGFRGFVDRELSTLDHIL